MTFLELMGPLWDEWERPHIPREHDRETQERYFEARNLREAERLLLSGLLLGNHRGVQFDQEEPVQ